MLDALPQEASAPTPQPRELDFRFTGKTGEYFRIWIVNLALTILTLGIYSAWALDPADQCGRRHLLPGVPLPLGADPREPVFH